MTTLPPRRCRRCRRAHSFQPCTTQAPNACGSLTLAEAKQRLAECEAAARYTDDEKTEGLVHYLMRDVLRAVATGSPDSMALATLALQADALEFGRGAHW